MNERPAREKKPHFNISFKGPALRLMMKLTKATGAENPRQMILTALMRYEADLIDEGKLTSSGKLHNQQLTGPDLQRSLSLWCEKCLRRPAPHARQEKAPHGLASIGTVTELFRSSI